jgi:hypothetical protein
MNDETQLLKSAVADYAAQTPAGEHPELERLIAFVDRDLGETERERVAEHVARCERCAETVRDFHAFDQEELEAEAAALEDETIAAQWQRLAKDLPAPEMQTAAVLPFYRRLSFAYGLAAVFAIAGLLSLWYPAGERPAGSLRVFHLSADGEVSRNNSQEATEVFFDGNNETSLMLVLPAGEYRTDQLRARLFDHDGDLVWEDTALYQEIAGSSFMAVRLPRQPEGTYRLEITSPENRAETPLATYSFPVVKPPVKDA